jgi:hypothetical protein
MCESHAKITDGLLMIAMHDVVEEFEVGRHRGTERLGVRGPSVGATLIISSFTPPRDNKTIIPHENTSSRSSPIAIIAKSKFSSEQLRTLATLSVTFFPFEKREITHHASIVPALTIASNTSLTAGLHHYTHDQWISRLHRCTYWARDSSGG